ILWLAGHGAMNDCCELRRQVGSMLGQWLRRRVQNQSDRAAKIARIERHFVTEEIVKARAGGINVTRRLGVAAVNDLFGSHEADRATNIVLMRQGGKAGVRVILGQAKV